MTDLCDARRVTGLVAVTRSTGFPMFFPCACAHTCNRENVSQRVTRHSVVELGEHGQPRGGHPPAAFREQLAIKRAKLVEAPACDGYRIPRRRCNRAV
jgi:hypothetical protein